MDEPMIETIKWTDLYDIHKLENFLMSLKYFLIKDIQIENEFQQTTLEGIKTYHTQNLDKSFEIVPYQVKILPDRNLEFFIVKTFKISNFPQVINFVSKHCPYIHDFIIDQNIETVEIGSNKLIRRLDNYESLIDKLKSFELIQNWLNKEDNQEELTPFILAALIQKFYQQRAFIFNLSSLTYFLKIKNHIDYVNSLLDKNIDSLKNYKIKQDTDTCLNNSRTQTFEFAGNQVFEFSNSFDIYNQNLDIKFLSYISSVNLREKASNAENNSNIL